jgi:hypothetical protein
MPKLIDYGVRFELMREAVVRLAAAGGAAAVTLAAVAQEVRLSTDTLRRTLRSPDVLPQLGVEHIARQRRHRDLTTPGLHNPSLPMIERVKRSFELELPLDEDRLVEGRAWIALTRSCALPAVLKHREAHESYLLALAARAVEVVPEGVRRCEQLRLFALVDGLVAGGCSELLTPEEMTSVLRLHLEGLAAQACDDVA